MTRIHKYARTHFGRRSKVVCKLNNLFTTGDIINHFKKFGTFTDLKKTGSQTTAELISICHLYQEINTEYRNKKDELRNKFAMRRTGFKQLDLFPSPQLNLFDGEQNDD
ncbi:hypothetical protein G3O08_17910 [Cryomorpha ignava]|uniref:Uncharacterized protein n=1 Tax=Cryomorpha ignava TaxID=101383 RepID=A0A7K3WXL5_9FLAO|nr:hypothetical protein [Cryomorpha ignava]NEN25375.1 hypothetical protein [Cryomorpha ignava]